MLRLRRTDDGASSVEYALILVAIAAVIVVAAFSFGRIVDHTFSNSCQEFASHTPTGSC